MGLRQTVRNFDNCKLIQEKTIPVCAIDETSNTGGTTAPPNAANAPATGASSLVPPALAQLSKARQPSKGALHYLPATKDTVHWGYYSKLLKPALTVKSGDLVTIEALTHHAGDDMARMVQHDHGAESVFHWTKEQKNIDRRGMGPMDAEIGAGGGLGVHICTGPIFVQDAEPGDVLEVRILDIIPRPSANPEYVGRTFGSNAAANWGFHYNDLITGDAPREVITIYEIDASATQSFARAVYNYRWTPQTDPFGVTHATIDYPGVPVDHSTIEKNYDILSGVKIPVRPHFGIINVAPAEAEMVNSVPPSYYGGNIDNWRVGKGASMFYPVAVDGALLSVGDPHASQGDAEMCGTAIECSLTGTFQLIVHKQADLANTPLEGLNFPMLETADEWVLHGYSVANHLAELGDNAQAEIFEKSSLDHALRDAFRKTRRFLMTTQKLTEDEAISLISVAVDYGVTQVVDGNWGAHGIIRKSMFDGRLP